MVETTREMIRTHLSGSHPPSLYHDRGHMIVIEGEPFVRMSHGTIVRLTDDWADSQAEADRRVLPELAKRIDALVRVADEIRSPKTVDEVIEIARESRAG